MEVLWEMGWLSKFLPLGRPKPCLCAELLSVSTIARASSSSLLQAVFPVEQMDPDVVLMPTVPGLARLR